MSTSDEVRLAVPARPEYLRLARVTAAGLASRLGFSFDQVEDLRLAIDELCFGLIGPDGRDGTVEVRYVLGGGDLLVEGRALFASQDTTADGGASDPAADGTGATTADGGPSSPGPARDGALSELSQVILSALVDEHEMIDDADGRRFRLVKRRVPLGGTGPAGSPGSR